MLQLHPNTPQATSLRSLPGVMQSVPLRGTYQPEKLKNLKNAVYESFYKHKYYIPAHTLFFENFARMNLLERLRISTMTVNTTAAA